MITRVNIYEDIMRTINESFIFIHRIYRQKKYMRGVLVQDSVWDLFTPAVFSVFTLQIVEENVLTEALK